MSFASVPAVTKPTLLTRGGPQILSALYYVWELACLMCRGVASLFDLLAQYLRRQTTPPVSGRDLEVHPYPIWRPVGFYPLKLTVVLDLDETLVSAWPRCKLPIALERNAKTGALHSLNLHCETGHGRRENLIVLLRPGLLEFLHKLAMFSEVVLFSAAVGSYGNALLDVLDPSRRVFSQRLFRESTVCTRVYQYVKDLTKLGSDLRRTVIVDNRACAFLMQPRNGIRCKPFRGNAHDRELASVILPILESLSLLNDVRPTLHSTFRMENWFKSKGFSI